MLFLHSILLWEVTNSVNFNSVQWYSVLSETFKILAINNVLFVTGDSQLSGPQLLL